LGESVNNHLKSLFLAACFSACLASNPCYADELQTARNHATTMAPLSAPDSNNRASMETMQIPSHGALMNALVYVAAGAGPHPAVILLHGFPGNERNLDLAQDMRRAGWDVLYFNYRGSWGTPGDFSFSHGIEDTAAALAYLRQPDVAKKLRLDPTRIVLIGHSMGGFMTVQGAAADPAIKAFALISAADMGGAMQQMLASGPKPDALHKMSAGLANEGMAPLNGCTPDGLARELADHAATWTFSSKVDALKNRTALIVTSDDGLAKPAESLAADLRNAGDTHVTTVHLPTDHAYSDQRIELSHAVLKWLATLPK
jgi:pimeloyl-ACP methyl ester carboxylesterase